MKILDKISGVACALVSFLGLLLAGFYAGFSYASDRGSITIGGWSVPGYGYRDGLEALYFLAVVVLLGYFLSKYVKKDIYKKMLIFSSLIISLCIFIGLISIKFTLVEKLEQSPELVRYVALLKETIIMDWVLFFLILLTIIVELFMSFYKRNQIE